MGLLSANPVSGSATVSLVKLIFLCLTLPWLPYEVLAQDGNPASLPTTTGDLSIYEGRPRVRAYRLKIGETVELDGRLDEAAWGRAIPAMDFIQQDPDMGQPATERTEVRFLLSGDTLYMGVTCYDSEPGGVMANTMQRDAPLSADDRFMWTFDTYLDARSAYYFEMNPNGSMGDALILSTNATNASDAGRAWDGIWNGEVQVSDIGWSLEVEIPFRTLNFDPNAPAWGVNFQRTIRRRQEESLWTGFERNQGLNRMANSGLLEGISDVSQGVGLDVQPFVTGKYVDAPGRNRVSEFERDGGVDFTYAITPSLRGQFTINTDFAETEVDQRRVNLTRFPLFFPERRLFFLEGTTVFDFARDPGAVIPFFSRRIGLDSDGQPQRIEYGVKLTGQIASRDIGLIHVRTASSENLVGEDFTVLRSKTNFFLQSYAGLIFTRRAERDSNVSDRHTVGADFSLRTSSFRGNENLELSGYYVWNTTTDAATGGANFGFRLDYPNEFWDARVSVREVQQGHDPGVGFIDRRGVRHYRPAVGFMPRPADNRYIRNFLFDGGLRLTTDLESRTLTRTTPARADVYFQSGDSIRFTLTPTYELLERAFEISPGVILPGDGAYNFTRYRLALSTTDRRALSVTTQIEKGGFFSGHRRNFDLNIGIRPMPGVLININNEWNRIELPEGSFSTRVLRFNANTQFSPSMSLVNNVQHDSVSHILGWQSRLRWILRPGNNFYFVYAHNWLVDPGADRVTLDRSATTKLPYTHRF